MFDEDMYLNANPDLREALSQGRLKSAYDYYDKLGRFENRPRILPDGCEDDTFFRVLHDGS